VLEGIDVSSHQGAIDWRSVASAGKSFAFIRASDGAAFPDARFATNWAGARAAGLTRGAYQFFRPTESATAQADLLLSSMGRLEQGDLPPALDVETFCAAPATQCAGGGASPGATADAISVWIDRVSRATGLMPILYTSPGFWSQLPARSLERRAIPWISHWYTAKPTVPGAWKRWAFWQYTDKGQVPGIQGPVDLDRFEGNRVDLRLLTRGGVARVVEVSAGGAAILAVLALGAALIFSQSGGEKK
jgi:GH25 family lysozyme M1 (1,4-beta-N-acetylmuramidase)